MQIAAFASQALDAESHRVAHAFQNRQMIVSDAELWHVPDVLRRDVLFFEVLSLPMNASFGV